MPKHLVLALTGASGSIYGLKLAEELLRGGSRLTLLTSHAGAGVLLEETGIDWRGDEAAVNAAILNHFRVGPDQLVHYDERNLWAPVASGSSAPDAMVVAPCSMGTLSRIAWGNSANLIERCADVMLKEGRPLALVPRETPLSAIHLENMLKLARLGVRIVPAMPAFYQKPASIDDLACFVAGKVLDALGIEHSLFTRWGDR